LPFAAPQTTDDTFRNRRVEEPAEKESQEILGEFERRDPERADNLLRIPVNDLLQHQFGRLPGLLIFPIEAVLHQLLADSVPKTALRGRIYLPRLLLEANPLQVYCFDDRICQLFERQVFDFLEGFSVYVLNKILAIFAQQVDRPVFDIFYDART
jgi:hypothetical protein